MIIKGSVKVIKKTDDYYKITKPVIIIAINTTPDIVVIIRQVKAIVTEINNKLCHAAIIAREYDIPIIMGVEHATKKFKNGQLISINTITKEII